MDHVGIYLSVLSQKYYITCHCVRVHGSLQHGPLQPLRVPPVYLGQPRHLRQLPLHTLGVAVDPLQTVHVGVQDLRVTTLREFSFGGIYVFSHLANLIDGVFAVLGLGASVQVRDDLLQVLPHPRELAVQILCQLKTEQ